MTRGGYARVRSQRPCRYADSMTGLDRFGEHHRVAEIHRAVPVLTGDEHQPTGHGLGEQPLSVPREAGKCELVILATKAMHVAQAAEGAKPLLDADTVVLSIQNGLGGPETAAQILGKERVMVGVVGGFGASMKGPGHAHHNGMELVRLGEFGGPITPRLEKVAEVWRGSGFRVKVFDDIDQLVWEKLICNCAYSGPCGLAEATIAEVMSDPDLSWISAQCASEGFAVAKKKGVKLGFDDPVAYVRDFGSKIPNARPSVLLDLMLKKKSEIDVINGSIPREAKKLGMAAPVNETVTALVKAKERKLGCK